MLLLMTPTSRPCTTLELAAQVSDQVDTFMANTPGRLKDYFSRVSVYRKQGQALLRYIEDHEGRPIEGAFIAYACAVALMVEKIPAHKDYIAGLTEEQRSILSAVRAILEYLRKLSCDGNSIAILPLSFWIYAYLRQTLSIWQSGDDIKPILERLEGILIRRQENYARGEPESAISPQDRIYFERTITDNVLNNEELPQKRRRRPRTKCAGPNELNHSTTLNDRSRDGLVQCATAGETSEVARLQRQATKDCGTIGYINLLLACWESWGPLSSQVALMHSLGSFPLT
jgi:hypothetical protein